MARRLLGGWDCVLGFEFGWLARWPGRSGAGLSPFLLIVDC